VIKISITPFAKYKVLTVIESADSFWKLVSKDRFPILKEFALKCIRLLETYRPVLKLNCFFSM